MKILVVGNITKDVYLNLDTRSENLETDSDHTEWLNLSFNASKHHFFNRSSNFGGAAVSIEVLQKMNLSATASDTNSKTTPSTYRYILLVNDNVTYFTPSVFCSTTFIAPAESVDYLYIDRSALPAYPGGDHRGGRGQAPGSLYPGVRGLYGSAGQAPRLSHKMRTDRRYSQNVQTDTAGALLQ